MRIPTRRYLFRVILCIPVFWFLITIFFIYSTNESKTPTIETTSSRTKFNVNPLNIIKRIIKYEPKYESVHPIHDAVRQQVIAPDIHDEKTDLNAPGEMGKAVAINKSSLLPTDLQKYDAGFEKNAFNAYVSDLISKHRSLPDVRDSGCRQFDYKSLKITAGIVMCFHNEAWSVLLRSIHSIVNRSPSHLLKEIVLVDDFSDMGKKICLEIIELFFSFK